MDALGDLFTFLGGTPAVVGLFLTSATIFVTSSWRLSLGTLLVQYLLLGLTLSRFLQPELSIVRVLVGILVVPILYLTAQRLHEARDPEQTTQGQIRFLGQSVGWDAGPLGLPLRLFTVLLVALAFVSFLPQYQASLSGLVVDGPAPPSDVIVVSFWLVLVGVVGLVLSGDALRVAPALLTVLAGFELVYAGLQTNPAVVGLLGTLTLLAALAFSYLAAVQGLGRAPAAAQEEATDQ
jgi:hypothetical protein